MKFYKNVGLSWHTFLFYFKDNQKNNARIFEDIQEWDIKLSAFKL